MAAPLSLKTVKLYLCFLSCIVLIAPAAVSRAETVSSTGLTLTVSPTGSYAVNSEDPPFRFAGDIGTPLTNLVTSAGMDNLGSYREIAFHYTSNGLRAASVRIYAEKPIVLFSVVYLESAPNAAGFPALTDYPQSRYRDSTEGLSIRHDSGYREGYKQGVRHLGPRVDQLVRKNQAGERLRCSTEPPRILDRQRRHLLLQVRARPRILRNTAARQAGV